MRLLFVWYEDGHKTGYATDYADEQVDVVRLERTQHQTNLVKMYCASCARLYARRTKIRLHKFNRTDFPSLLYKCSIAQCGLWLVQFHLVDAWRGCLGFSSGPNVWS